MRREKGLCGSDGDIAGLDVADYAVVIDEIPALPLAADIDLGAAWDDENREGIQAGKPIDGCAPGGGNGAGIDGLRTKEGDVKILGQGKDDIGGDGVDVIFNPAGVLIIVVVGEFNQDGRGPGQADFPDGRGGEGADLRGIEIDVLEVLDDNISSPFSVDAAGIIVNVRPLELSG